MCNAEEGWNFRAKREKKDYAKGVSARNQKSRTNKTTTELLYIHIF
jgi:hypothetical protein